MHGTRRPRSPQSGLTLVELMIAIFISSVVVLALGRFVVSHERMIIGGRNQAYLQQEMSRMFDTLGRDIHSSHAVYANGTSQFSTYDRDGSVLHVYAKTASGGSYRLTRDGTALTDRACRMLNITTDADSTVLDLSLSLADVSGNQADGYIRLCVRNRALEF